MAPKRKRTDPSKSELEPKTKSKSKPKQSTTTKKTKTTNTSSFFQLPSAQILRQSLEDYPKSLAARSEEHKDKPKDLIDLDRFVHDELPSRIHEGLSMDDFVKVYRWKLLRGKFRPLIPMFIKNNTDAGVRDCTRRAAMIINDPDSDPVEALDPLLEMKGVGPATASAFLALFPSGKLPFFSDEVYEAFGDRLGVIKYSDKAYRQLFNCVQELVEKTNTELDDKYFTPSSIERAIWAWRYNQR